MRRFELDPDWYRLKYNLAVSQVRLAVTREETDHDRLGDRGRQDVLSGARRTALELSVTAADTRNTLRHRRWIRRPKRLNAFLRELVEPGGRVLLAEALLAEPKAKVGRLVDGEPGLNEDAITRSLRGMLDGEKADVPLPETLARSVGPREDRRAEGGIPAPSAQGRPDRGEDLGGRGGGGRASGRSRDGLAAEVHYELACYFSQLYGVLEERAVQAQPAEPTAARGPEVETDALKELACCLRRLDRGARRDQIQWARRDPLLASVRDSGGAGREFTQQLERYSRPATQQELGELQAIGPDGAKRSPRSALRPGATSAASIVRTPGHGWRSSVRRIRSHGYTSGNFSSSTPWVSGTRIS